MWIRASKVRKRLWLLRTELAEERRLCESANEMCHWAMERLEKKQKENQQLKEKLEEAKRVYTIRLLV